MTLGVGGDVVDPLEDTVRGSIAVVDTDFLAAGAALSGSGRDISLQDAVAGIICRLAGQTPEVDEAIKPGIHLDGTVDHEVFADAGVGLEPAGPFTDDGIEGGGVTVRLIDHILESHDIRGVVAEPAFPGIGSGPPGLTGGRIEVRDPPVVGFSAS